MKFVIWGAGNMGRRLRYFLGSLALAYIDVKTFLQGHTRDGLEVLSFQQYLERKEKDFSEAWIIVSPRDLSEEIIEELHQAGLQNYFLLSDAPNNFMDHPLEQLAEQLRLRCENGEEIEFDGLNCFHAALYEMLERSGHPPVIWISAGRWEEEKGRRSMLSAWNIRRKDGKEGYEGELVDDEALLATVPNAYATPWLEKFRDMYAGKRCFVVATGPSLRVEDLETLRQHGEICISMNGIYHAFHKVEWRPDFFFMADTNLIRLVDVIDQMDVPYKLISDLNMDFWKLSHPDNVYRFHTRFSDLKRPEKCFSDDFIQGPFGSGTITCACIQFAIFLGCREIYLLGLDFSAHMGKRDGASDHFTKDYLSDYQKEDLQSRYTDDILHNVERIGYKAACRYADTHPPLKIYNATRGGYLEVFERVDFDSLF